MKAAQREWTCLDCGRRNETAVADAEALTCESCTEELSATPEAPSKGLLDDDTRRRGVVARLRQRYGEAREFVLTGPLDAQAHEHLEWILGKRGNPERGGTALGTEVSELVVLWLQDLVRELDDQAFVPGAPGSDGDAASTAGVRQGAADGLRTATRDFAEEFLRIQTGAAPRP